MDFLMSKMNIKLLRTELNLTQIEFSQKLGIAQPQLSKWEVHGAPHYFENLAKMYLTQIKSNKQ